MARLRGHRQLDYDQPLFVRRAALTLSGVEFKLGDELPWRDLKIDPRKVHQLWAQRRIGHEKPGERPRGAEAPYRRIARPKSPAPVPVPLDPDSLTEAQLEALTAPEPQPAA